MKFLSTNKKIRNYSFKQVLLEGLAPDKGLFMPEKIPQLPREFFKKLPKFLFIEIAKRVASNFVSEIPKASLKKIINSAFNFPVPLKKLDDNLYVLELFHGPTMAFKDFGARFLAQSMGYFVEQNESRLNIIVATSGDTGSAVASSFFKMPKIHVYILYPSKKISPLQEKQLTTFGGNITAFEIKGSFDDCQQLAKKVLADKDLKEINFFSADSINFGRLLPQSFYYFYAAGQLQKRGEKKFPVFVVPSGNFGNLTSGILAKKMGLPVAKFIAATNVNDIVPKYLKTGVFKIKKSEHTISNAMDVGSPSNFARMLELYRQSQKLMSKEILGFSFSDIETRREMAYIYKKYKYTVDPHTAVGLCAAKKYLKNSRSNNPVIVLSTASPTKFKEIVEPVIKKKILYPRQLKKFIDKKKNSILISKDYKKLKRFLLNS